MAWLGNLARILFAKKRLGGGGGGAGIGTAAGSFGT